jgi:glycerol-3-phosphate acyltransferase PlsX
MGAKWSRPESRYGALSGSEAGSRRLSATPVTGPFTLAIDAMGGDNAPDMVVHGLDIAAERHPSARFLLLGDEPALTALLGHHKRARAACTVRHAAAVISSEMKPTAALRTRQSSMRLAIDAVASGEASGLVSAGNTGALLTLAKIFIKSLPGIDRPAMAGIGPSARGDVVMLDLGANVQCDVRNLVQFAVMGDVFARTVLGLTAPTIGLLNVGSEELKGDDTVREAAEILRSSHIGPQFHGFVEGHDIAAGTVDVIVTDGFTGNVALKTGEGALKLIGQFLKQVFSSSIAGKIAYLLVRPGLDRLREWLDPRRYNGAVMVGLNAVVVKSHGGTDAQGFAHAVDVAMDMVVHRFNDRIREDLARIELDKRGAAEKDGGDRRTATPANDSPPNPATSSFAATGTGVPPRSATDDTHFATA